jgi:hypothetical protein
MMHRRASIILGKFLYNKTSTRSSCRALDANLAATKFVVTFPGSFTLPHELIEGKVVHTPPEVPNNHHSHHQFSIAHTSNKVMLASFPTPNAQMY